jgi:hypothetical protein
MAAAITSTATTLEKQILEFFQAANTQEKALSDALNQGRFSISVDPESGEVSMTATLKCTVTSVAGELKLVPDVYLP